MRKLRILLYPLGILYGCVMAVRNMLFELNLLRSIRFDLPVIGIGNLAVGGTGKTPHIAFLTSHLKGSHQVAILSRGYGRKTKGFYLVKSDSKAEEVGDEPLMLKHQFPDVQIAVCENRVDGMVELLAQFPEIDIVLLDDVFQHRHISPGLMILLSDYNKPYFRDHVLPAGDLREFRPGQRRADVTVFTRSPKDIDRVRYRSHVISGEISFTGLKYAELRLVNGPESDPGNAVVVTGIADPRHLITHLDPQVAVLNHMRFPDHHRYSDKDIKEIMRKLGKVAGSVVITTSKDWVKLKPFFQPLTEVSVFVQDVEVAPMDDQIIHMVDDYINNWEKKEE